MTCGYCWRNVLALRAWARARARPGRARRFQRPAATCGSGGGGERASVSTFLCKGTSGVSGRRLKGNQCTTITRHSTPSSAHPVTLIATPILLSRRSPTSIETGRRAPIPPPSYKHHPPTPPFSSQNAKQHTHHSHHGLPPVPSPRQHSPGDPFRCRPRSGTRTQAAGSRLPPSGQGGLRRDMAGVFLPLHAKVAASFFSFPRRWRGVWVFLAPTRPTRTAHTQTHTRSITKLESHS